MRQIQVQVDFQDDYRISEAFKTLRTNIRFCGANNKVIMVTSCLQSDGKTTVSFGIAKAFADDGQKVLLLDTDLRKSVMSRRLLGEDISLGTTSVLSQTNSFEECVCTTQISNLDVMFAGAVPPNPVELLGSPAFVQMLVDLRERYDIIIVDTPPLGAVIDAAVVAKNCDGSVLVICANTISRHFAKNVLDQLQKSGCPVLGTVLNRVAIHNSRFYKGSYYRYGKYYKKYYRYGYGKGDYGYGYGDNPYLGQGKSKKK